MKVTFDDIMRPLLKIEGDFSDHPDDPGGKTRFGITEVTARAAGYTGKMRELPWELARSIYKSEYWDKIRGDFLIQYEPSLAFEMMDVAINASPKQATLFLQRWLSALNRQGKDYPDIKDDGAFGQKTLAALASYARKRGQEGLRALAAGINADQGVFYRTLAEHDPSFESFLNGWLQRRVLEQWHKRE